MKMNTKIMGVIMASAMITAPAFAIPVLSTFAQFTQQSNDKVVEYRRAGPGNTLSIVNAPANFVVTDAGPLGVYSSLLSMTASSSSTITNTGPQFEQIGWNGQMTFTNGVNQLTAAFTNAAFNFTKSGGAGSLIVNQPLNSIAYSSDILALSAFTFRNLSLSFTGMNPAFTIGGDGFGTNFDANIAGSFAGAAVPEPASWAMMLAGFGLVGFASRRRSSRAVVAA